MNLSFFFKPNHLPLDACLFFRCFLHHRLLSHLPWSRPLAIGTLEISFSLTKVEMTRSWQSFMREWFVFSNLFQPLLPLFVDVSFKGRLLKCLLLRAKVGGGLSNRANLLSFLRRLERQEFEFLDFMRLATESGKRVQLRAHVLTPQDLQLVLLHELR